jgi:hypothetical protein
MDKRQELVIVDSMPDYRQFDYARIGSFTITTKDKRYALAQDVISIDGQEETHGGHFRQSVKRLEFGNLNPPIPISYPYYAIPCKFPLCRYYDVRRAYHQLASAYGGEVFIKEGKACYYGDSTFTEEVFTLSRIARGLIVSGTAEKTSFDIWENGSLRSQVVPNSIYAPHLRMSVNYTLHAIIHLIKRWIIYAMTDGFIVPWIYWDKVEAWLNVRNIDYSIKHEGPAEVITRGTYSIGDHKTATFGLWPRKSCDYIIDSKALWWLKKLDKGKELHG